jgi:N-acetylglutamate synthase
MTRGDFGRLEAIAFRAWPAATVVEHRGMKLRSTGGQSRRANSAAVHACDAALSLDEAVGVAEAFYDERAQPRRFQIGPTAPRGLDAALAARGYSVTAPVWAQTALVDALAAAGRPSETAITAEVAAQAGDAWVDLEVTRGRYADIATRFVDLVARLAPHAGFATAFADGSAVAACLLVVVEDVVVVSAMRTVPEARRRGAATALLRASAAWATHQSVTRAYLQVERDNAAALPLYAAAGFVSQYGYHYRERAPEGTR